MHSETPSKRLFINISSIKDQSLGRSKFWLLAVDDVTNLLSVFPLKLKDQMATTMISLIKGLHNKKNIAVKKIRCNNSGENVAFLVEAKCKGLGLNFEFTACQTPQQNG